MNRDIIPTTETSEYLRMHSCVIRMGWTLCAFLLASIPSAQLSAQQPVEVESQVDATAAQVATPLEQKVKAAFIYNYCKYFDWPESIFGGANEPFVIGVLGADPLGKQLDKLAKKKSVKSRKIKIVRFSSMEEYQACHLLFVTRTVNEDEFQLALRTTQATSVLVVSERPIAASRGSAVQMFVDETDTVGFAIDVDVVNARHLQVSAKLLKLARVSPSQTSSK